MRWSYLDFTEKNKTKALKPLHRSPVLVCLHFLALTLVCIIKQKNTKKQTSNDFTRREKPHEFFQKIISSCCWSCYKKLADFISMLNRNKILSDQNHKIDILPPVSKTPLLNVHILHTIQDSIASLPNLIWKSGQVHFFRNNFPYKIPEIKWILNGYLHIKLFNRIICD